MCRFLGYIGRQPLVLNSLLDHYENSLVTQSRRARETKSGLNADGFGVGWYDRSISARPGVFKSTQPAWNDSNLTSLASVVRSNCFIGHVRASTVGDVSLPNCHPFLFGHMLSAHNGTIMHFQEIQRDLYNLLHEDDFRLVRGQTDSEHLSALVSTLLRQVENPDIEDYEAAIREAMTIIHSLQEKRGVEPIVRANLLYTDGVRFIALRYSTDPTKNPWSLYFSEVEVIDETGFPKFHGDREVGTGVVIASERLTDREEEWGEVLPNGFFRIDKELRVSVSRF